MTHFDYEKDPFATFRPCVTLEFIHRVPTGRSYSVSQKCSFHGHIFIVIICFKPTINLILSGNGVENNVMVFLHNKKQVVVWTHEFPKIHLEILSHIFSDDHTESCQDLWEPKFGNLHHG